ncbi:hypothetical protein OCGS_0266 [Oceaniovalibus guishaninsula JLT2003]|uniref:Uncharacterized protein n=1 Tax=Oceaniovalibus guishaninsula JLT2003 TaxID=1231392 RepID=K2HSR2_9RHOB|nr:hypothetical protein OCGS_0266 [Oceaniovalibus guishaninsula JLT2003]
MVRGRAPRPQPHNGDGAGHADMPETCIPLRHPRPYARPVY